MFVTHVRGSDPSGFGRMMHAILPGRPLRRQRAVAPIRVTGCSRRLPARARHAPGKPSPVLAANRVAGDNELHNLHLHRALYGLCGKLWQMTAVKITQSQLEHTRTEKKSCKWLARRTVGGVDYEASSRRGASTELARVLVRCRYPRPARRGL